MQPALLTAHKRLDDLMIEALAAFQQLPAAPPSENEVSIEIVDEDEVACTTRFVRISAPYECVEVAPASESNAAVRVTRPRPRTFVRTVPAGTAPAAETLQFDKAWFEQPADELAALEEPAPEVSRTWWWLIASLAVAAGVVSFFAVYTNG